MAKNPGIEGDIWKTRIWEAQNRDQLKDVGQKTEKSASLKFVVPGRSSKPTVSFDTKRATVKALTQQQLGKVFYKKR